MSDAWERFIATRDPAAREELILRYHHLVNMTRQRILPNVPRNVTAEDCESAGTLGLIRALDRFDPRRGAKFETMAITWIRGAICEWLRHEDWVPRSVRQRERVLVQAEAALEDRGGAYGDPERAQALGMTLDAYYDYAARGTVYRVQSLEALIPVEDSEIDADIPCIDRIAADTAGIGETAWDRERDRLLVRAIERLPARHREVIRLYYWEGATMAEIARAIGRSETRVSQMHREACARIRRMLYRHEEAIAGGNR